MSPRLQPLDDKPVINGITPINPTKVRVSETSRIGIQAIIVPVTTLTVQRAKKAKATKAREKVPKQQKAPKLEKIPYSIGQDYVTTIIPRAVTTRPVDGPMRDVP